MEVDPNVRKESEQYQNLKACLIVTIRIASNHK